MLILTHQQQTVFENVVGNEEIARNEQFLLFPQCFVLNKIIVPHLSIFLTSYFYLLLNMEEPKIGISGKGLNANCNIISVPSRWQEQLFTRSRVSATNYTLQYSSYKIILKSRTAFQPSYY